jgi:hypothetical protein
MQTIYTTKRGEEKRVGKEKTGKETRFLCLVTVFSQKQSPQLLIGTP